MPSHFSLIGAALLLTASTATSQNSVRTVDLSPLHQDTIFADARPGTTEATFAAIRDGGGTTTTPTITVPELGLTKTYSAPEFALDEAGPVLMALNSDRRGHGFFFNRIHDNGARHRAFAFKVSGDDLEPMWYYEYTGPAGLNVRFERVIRIDSVADPAFLALASINNEGTALIRIGADGFVHWARTYDFASEELAVLDLVPRDDEIAAIVCAQKNPNLARPAVVLQMIAVQSGNVIGRPRRLREFGTTVGLGLSQTLGMAFAPSFGIPGSTGDLYVAKNSSINGNIVVAAIGGNGVPGTTVHIPGTQGYTPNVMTFAGDGKLIMSVTNGSGAESFIHLNEVDITTGGTFTVVRTATNSSAYTGVAISDLVSTTGSPFAVASAQVTIPADSAVWFDNFDILTSSCLPLEAWLSVRARNRLTWQNLPRVDVAFTQVTPLPRLITSAPSMAPVRIFCD